MPTWGRPVREVSRRGEALSFAQIEHYGKAPQTAKQMFRAIHQQADLLLSSYELVGADQALEPAIMHQLSSGQLD